MKLNPEDIPHEYAHCFATGEQCPQRAQCLRALIAELPLKAAHQRELVIPTVDPRYVASLHGRSNCALYRTTAPARYARGMTHMYDEVPGKAMADVKRQVQRCFSCRNYYFTSRKGERLITPAEQRQIAAVFHRLCPNLQPVFDGFEENFEW